MDLQQWDIYTIRHAHTHTHTYTRRCQLKREMNSWLNAMDFKSMEHKIRSDTMINGVSNEDILNKKCPDFCHKRN